MQCPGANSSEEWLPSLDLKGWRGNCKQNLEAEKLWGNIFLAPSHHPSNPHYFYSLANPTGSQRQGSRLSCPYKPASAESRVEEWRINLQGLRDIIRHFSWWGHVQVPWSDCRVICYIILYLSPIPATFLIMYFELILEINSIICLWLTQYYWVELFAGKRTSLFKVSF